jgi:uncharacterized membrane protein YbaN (DUF454 family)
LLVVSGVLVVLPVFLRTEFFFLAAVFFIMNSPSTACYTLYTLFSKYRDRLKKCQGLQGNRRYFTICP